MDARPAGDLITTPLPGIARWRGGDGGFGAVGVALAMTLTLVLVTWFAHTMMIRYSQGVMRHAVNDGARAGAASGADPERCRARAQAAADTLLAGAISQGLQINCWVEGNQLVASVQVTFRGVPPIPDSAFASTARATFELEENLVVP